MTNHFNGPYRGAPEDGHALLLMQNLAEQRTFSDYSDLNTCLETIIELYEQSRVSAGDLKDDYDIKKLWEWIDGFRTMELFIFDKEIARYKRHTRTELKELFVRQIKKLEDPTPNQNHRSSGSAGLDEDDDSDAEQWGE